MNLKEILGELYTDEIATKIGDKKIVDIGDGNWIPKDKFDEVNNKSKTYKEQSDALNVQLEDIKKSVKGNEEFTKTITDLQTKLGESEGKIKNISVNSAIEKALLKAQAKHPDLLLSKFDTSKIVIKDDGTVEGLDDQVKTLSESYKDLFGEKKMTGGNPNNGGNPNEGVKRFTRAEINKMSPQEAIANMKQIDKQLAEGPIE